MAIPSAKEDSQANEIRDANLTVSHAAITGPCGALVATPQSESASSVPDVLKWTPPALFNSASMCQGRSSEITT